MSFEDEHAFQISHLFIGLKKMIKIITLLVLLFSTILSGCATVGGTPNVSQEFINQVSEKRITEPLNPRHGDVVWGKLKIGMTAEEVLGGLPNSKFDEEWSSGGVVGVMAEAGIFATNKIKVKAEIVGPFKSKSFLYVLFDQAGRLDGIVIMTSKNDLPDVVMQNHGIGFYLVEYKEAAKIIIGDYAIPELGARKGLPRFGKEQLDSIGSVMIGKSISPNVAMGFGIPTSSISPATIIQNYEREGYRSILSIRALYLGLYNVYAAPIVFMSIQAKQANEKNEDF